MLGCGHRLPYAIMLKEEGTEKYTEYTEKNSWPTTGYKYNVELSNCIDIDGNTTAGVSGTVGCSDTFSGCTNNTFNFSGVKVTNSVQIKDKAGNVSKCVQINGRVQKSTNSCYSHSNCHGENVCPTPCKVWSCFDNNVSGNQKYQTGCVTERPSLRCSPVSSGWTDCYWHTWSDNSCSCTGWYGWSNWNDAQSCTANSNSTTTLVRCQTLYY